MSSINKRMKCSCKWMSERERVIGTHFDFLCKESTGEGKEHVMVVCLAGYHLARGLTQCLSLSCSPSRRAAQCLSFPHAPILSIPACRRKRGWQRA